MTKRLTVQEWRMTGGAKLPRFELHDNGVLEIHLTPMGKPRQTQRDKWDKRACVVRYRDMADQLRAACKINGYELGNRLFVEFHLPMAKSWSKKKQREKLGSPHDQKPDIDNMCKSVMDALSKEDKEVHTCYARKFWSESGKPGKIVLFPSGRLFLEKALF